MRTILLDTNFLLIPVQFNVDVYTQARELMPDSELIVLKQSLKELEKVKKGDLALKVMNSMNVNIINTSISASNVDELILRYAQKNDCIIATQDKELKQKALKNGVSVLILRQRKYLQLIEGS